MFLSQMFLSHHLKDGTANLVSNTKLFTNETRYNGLYIRTFIFDEVLRKHHYVKYVRIKIFSDPYFPVSGQNFQFCP